MIVLGSIPTLKSPYKHILKVVPRSKLYIELRNLFSRRSRSRVDDCYAATKQAGHKKQKEDCVPLDNYHGDHVTNITAFPQQGYTRDPGYSLSIDNLESAGEADGNIEMIHSFEIV